MAAVNNLWRSATRAARCTKLIGAGSAAIMALAAPVGACPAAHAAAHHTIILTFIRHAESTANATHIIDTSTPGPDITAVGEGQAAAVANELSANRYDGIYASTMVRTQETAAPLAQTLGEPVTVLADLREIEAGDNEGLPEASARPYPAPQVWLNGDRTARIPGSINGTEFESRFTDAVNTIYDSGETNPVVFSHGEAITYWVLMNVKNPDMRRVDPLLPNTGHVVVTGNPTDGWTLNNWDGTTVPAPTSR
jgi:broad specificity phosphatase PhoE